MNKVIVGILAGLAMGAAVTGVLLRHHDTGQQGQPEEPKEESFVRHGTNGETFLHLDAKTQTLMGLRVSPLAAVKLQPEVKGYGRVLDPAPLAALLTEVAYAETAVDVSKKELSRVKQLYEHGQNTSQRALEVAEGAVRRDEIALDGARMKVMVGWGEAFMPGPKLAQMLESLVSRRIALVRVDLPLAESLKAAPTGGRLASLNSPEAMADAQLLGPAPSTDPQMQGQGFLFLQQTNPLPPGAAVVAWLTIPGGAESGVMVPREALLRHEGRAFIYLQTSNDTFQRKEVALGRPSGAGWFMDKGLKPQDKVVVVGAQQLLSEELKGQMGGE